MNSEPAAVSCESCVAACCRAPASLILHRDEVRRHGVVMGLTEIAKPRNYRHVAAINVATVDGSGRDTKEAQNFSIPRWYGFYLFDGTCGNLDESTNRCTIYERRPGCCRELEPGSETCLNLRRGAGLDLDSGG